MSSDTRLWCGAGSVLNMITPLLSVVFHRLALSLTRRFVQMPCGHRVEITRTAQLTRCVLCRHVWLAGKTGFLKTACVLTSGEVRKTRTVGPSENCRCVLTSGEVRKTRTVGPSENCRCVLTSGEVRKTITVGPSKNCRHVQYGKSTCGRRGQSFTHTLRAPLSGTFLQRKEGRMYRKPVL